MITDRMRAAALPFGIKVYGADLASGGSQMILYRHTRNPTVFYARVFVLPLPPGQLATEEGQVCNVIRDQADLFLDSMCRLAYYTSQRFDP